MAFVYKQHSPERCKASVHNGPGGGHGFHQCLRKPWLDGWCKQHHPSSEQRRQAAAQVKYDAEWAATEKNLRRQETVEDLLAACDEVLAIFQRSDLRHSLEADILEKAVAKAKGAD